MGGKVNWALLVLTVATCAACLFLATQRSSATGVTSCAKIAHDYVVQVAAAQNLEITYYKLLACHQLDADHSVARVHVAVNYYGLVQDVVLVYHLTKSPWQIADVHPVG